MRAIALAYRERDNRAKKERWDKDFVFIDARTACEDYGGDYRSRKRRSSFN
jgi:hypothetical protein